MVKLGYYKIIFLVTLLSSIFMSSILVNVLLRDVRTHLEDTIQTGYFC